MLFDALSFGEGVACARLARVYDRWHVGGCGRWVRGCGHREEVGGGVRYMLGFDSADVAGEDGRGMVVDGTFFRAAWDVGRSGVGDLGKVLVLQIE